MEVLRKHPRLSALLLTLLWHALVVALLAWLVLEVKHPNSKREEILLIDLGDVLEAQGSEEPGGDTQDQSATATEAATKPRDQEVSRPEPPKPQASVQETKSPRAQKQGQAEPQQNIQTQRHEESLRQREAESQRQREALDKKAQEALERRQRQEQARLAQVEAERKARAEAEARARAEQLAQEQAERRAKASQSVAQAFGAGRNKGSQGNASGSGNQGDVQGSAGGTFSLEGRRVLSNGGNLSPPQVNKAIEGRIVVQIVVDAKGQVTSASVSPRGTTIADASVRSEALRAARSTTFNAQEGASPQRGTITYIYVIKG